MITTDQSSHVTDQTALIKRIKLLGDGSYLDVRALDDGTIVGIGRLLFTTAVYVDMNEWGWEQRFCFDNAVLAMREYMGLRTMDDEPSGWIARRPKRPGDREED